jgi:benzil reductase ((S)-benzoin forming)
MDQGMESAADRFAVVTGTTRGIGAAVAARLIERGWQLVGIARHPAPIDHPRYRHLLLDLEDSAALGDTVERQLTPVVADTRWRRVALVNNAAASGVLGPVETIDPLGLLRLSAVNWIAPTWLIGFVLRRARADVALRIVNVSSGAAVRAFPGLADYCGSKAALRMTAMVTAPLSAYPWGGLFRDFAARGALAPPTAPASEIVDFLETDGHPRFSERRLGQ